MFKSLNAQFLTILILKIEVINKNNIDFQCIEN